MNVLALAALTLLYPHTWHVTTQPQLAVTDPVQRFALYSGAALPANGPPRRNQVVAIVLEQEPPSRAGFPPRPTRFRLPRLGALENLSGNRWGEILFRDHGRSFYVFVWIGRSANGRVPELLTALDSLRVS